MINSSDETVAIGEAAKPSLHLAWLDSLRALAALWVVLHHAFTGQAVAWGGPLGHGLYLVLANGQLAVASFIAISGYSLTLPVLKNGLKTRSSYKEFVLSRFIRIVPPYYFAVLLALGLTGLDVALGHTHFDAGQIHRLVVAVPMHLLLLQDVDAQPLTDLPRWSNGVFWTIGVELKIYLFFPVILAIVRKRGFVPAFFATALLAFVLFFLPRQNYTHKASYLLIFFMGVATCYASRARVPKFGAFVALASFGVWAILVSTAPAPLVGFYMSLRDVAIGAATCGTMYALSADERLRRLFEPRWLVFIGTFAYSIYLVHVQMIQVALNFFVPPTAMDGATKAFFSVALVVVFALVAARSFFVLCERPFFKKRHREAERILT